MAKTDLHLRGEAPWRRRAGAAATFALMAHLAILGLFLYSMPRFSPYAREGRSISLDIVEPSTVRKLTPPPRVFSRKPAPAAAGTPETPATQDRSTAQAAPAPPTAQVPFASSDSAALGAATLGKALRSSAIGCTHADMVDLTDAERQHCRDSFAGNRADAPDLSQLAISPEKRAIFDAAWKADHSAQHMAGVICLARFGGGKLQWLHPSEGVKIGPLPCYAFTPKATFSADPPHARGWR